MTARSHGVNESLVQVEYKWLIAHCLGTYHPTKVLLSLQVQGLQADGASFGAAISACKKGCLASMLVQKQTGIVAARQVLHNTSGA